MQSSALETLIHVNTNDVLTAVGLDRPHPLQGVVRWACRPLARRFSEQLLQFDQLNGAEGLHIGARFILRQHTRAVYVNGAEQIPTSGPLLLLANHPGLGDAAAVFATFPRPIGELRTLGLERDFLRALPNTLRHIIPMPNDPGQRTARVREAMRHLKSGQVLLLYPAGRIEVDPAIATAGALESLPTWSDSIRLFVRSVPETVVAPVIVRGAVSAAAQANPLTWFRRAPKDKAWLAAILQVIFRQYQNVDIRVAYGAPLAGRTLLADEATLMAQVRAAAAQLIEHPPATWQAVP